MDFVDVRFINLISSRTPKFKRVKPDLYNFRCTNGGVAEVTLNKARG